MNLNWLLGMAILALFMVWWPARADEPGDLYQHVYLLIQEADSLDAGGQSGPALAKYREAQTVLQDLKKENPTWNSQAVSYRLNYLAGKIAALSEKAAKPATGGPAPGPQEPQPEAKPASGGSTWQVKLLEAGAEPRKVLRLHPKPGDKQSLTLTMKIAMDLQAGQTPSQSMKMPTIRMSRETTVRSVSPNGDILYDVTMGDFEVGQEADANPQIAQAMKAAFSGFKGLSGSATMSDRGVGKGTEMKTPAGSDPQLGQLVDQMRDAFARSSVLLPEEAVGPGARWEVKMPLKSQGMTIDQATAYQLVSIEGDLLTVKDTVEHHASNQKIQSPAMPGLVLDLTKMVGKGSDEMALDLTQLMPRERTSTLVEETVMEMNVGGQKTTMTGKTSIDLRFEGK
jgi:hypothetical protein